MQFQYTKYFKLLRYRILLASTSKLWPEIIHFNRWGILSSDRPDFLGLKKIRSRIASIFSSHTHTVSYNNMIFRCQLKQYISFSYVAASGGFVKFSRFANQLNRVFKIQMRMCFKSAMPKIKICFT